MFDNFLDQARAEMPPPESPPPEPELPSRGLSLQSPDPYNTTTEVTDPVSPEFMEIDIMLNLFKCTMDQEMLEKLQNAQGGEAKKLWDSEHLRAKRQVAEAGEDEELKRFQVLIDKLMMPPPAPMYLGRGGRRKQSGGTLDSFIGAFSGFTLPCAICFMRWLVDFLKKRRNNLVAVKEASSQSSVIDELKDLVEPVEPVESSLMEENISYYSNKDFYFLMADFYEELKNFIYASEKDNEADRVAQLFIGRNALLGDFEDDVQSGSSRFTAKMKPADKRRAIANEPVFVVGDDSNSENNIFEKIEQGSLKTTSRTFKDVFEKVLNIVRAIWPLTGDADGYKLRHDLLSIVVPFLIKHNPQYNQENKLVSFSTGQDIINEIKTKLSNMHASVGNSALCKAVEDIQYFNILTTVLSWAAGAYGLAYSGSSFLTAVTELNVRGAAVASSTFALTSIFAVASIGNTTSNNFQKEAFYSLKPLIDIARIDKNKNIRDFATYISTSAGYLNFHNWLRKTTLYASPVPASSRGTTGADAAQRSRGVESSIPGAAEAAAEAAGADSIEEKMLRVAAALDFLNAQREEGAGEGGGSTKRRLVDVKEFARPSGSPAARTAETNWMETSAYFPEGGINTQEKAASVTYTIAPKSRGKFAGYKSLNDFLTTLIIRNSDRSSSNGLALNQFIENIYTVATKEGLEYAGEFVPAGDPVAAARPKKSGGGGKARKTRKLKGGRRNKYCEPKKCYTYCAQSIGKRRTRKRKKCAPKKSKKGYCYQRVSKDGYKYCYWNKGGPKGKCKTKKAKKVYFYNRV